MNEWMNIYIYIFLHLQMQLWLNLRFKGFRLFFANHRGLAPLSASYYCLSFSSSSGSSLWDMNLSAVPITYSHNDQLSMASCPLVRKDVWCMCLFARWSFSSMDFTTIGFKDPSLSHILFQKQFKASLPTPVRWSDNFDSLSVHCHS